MSRYALISPDSPHYGLIISFHRSLDTAEAALERRCRRVLRRYPNALTGLMYEITEVHSGEDLSHGRARRRGVAGVAR